jgi:hypothetical protein
VVLVVGVGDVWANVLCLAFEGPAHPHKANILKYPGQKVFEVSEEEPVERIDLGLASEISSPSELAAR